MSAIDPPVSAPSWELFTPEHDRLRATVRAWVAEHLLPHIDEWEREGEFPRALYKAAGAAGLFGWKVTPEYGGSGPDYLADVVIAEELARAHSGGVAAALGAHKDLGPYYIWRFGTEAQRRRWVVPAVRGEIVGALGVTEPQAGSDVAGLRTRAVRQPGGDWLLNGTKTFITNGTWADVLVIAAVTDPEAGGHHGQSLFVVEADDPGFSARRIPTLGWRTSHTGELSFADVRLPADRLLGGEDLLHQGFVCIMRNFQWERIAMANAAVVAAEDTLAAGAAMVMGQAPGEAPTGEALMGQPPTGEALTGEALTGEGGRTLGAWTDPFAELATELAAVRALSEHALRRFLHGEDAVREVSMAKWYACELAVRVADTVLQAAGPEGCAANPALQRALRDTRLGPIGGGTTEIMQEVIGRGFGL